MKTLTIVLSIILASQSFANSHHAKKKEFTPDAACASDVELLCKGFIGGEEVRKCLTDNHANLSDECKAKFKVAKAKKKHHKH